MTNKYFSVAYAVVIFLIVNEILALRMEISGDKFQFPMIYSFSVSNKCEK